MRWIKLIAAVAFWLFFHACFSPDSTAQVGQVEELFEARRYDDARRTLQPVLASDPDDPVANYWLGRIELYFGNFDIAQEHLELAVKNDERNVEYHLQLSAVYREKARRAGWFNAARFALKWKAELKRAVELEPQNVRARKRLAVYLMNAPAIGGGDKDKAMEMAKETIPMDEVEGRLMYAYSLRHTDDEDRAIGEYEKVLHLDPDNGEAHNHLGYLYLSRDDFASAEIHFLAYLVAAPDEPNAHDSLGDYYARRGMIAEAIAQYERALTIEPRLSGTRFRLAEQCAKAGHKSEAIRHYRELIELTPNAVQVKEARARLAKLQK